MSEKDRRQYEIDTRGHQWQIDSFDGELDIFAYEAGDFHNGPRCVKCGYGFCHHCQEMPDEDCDA